MGLETAPEARNPRGLGKADFDHITHIWTDHMSLSNPGQITISHAKSVMHCAQFLS